MTLDRTLLDRKVAVVARMHAELQRVTQILAVNIYSTNHARQLLQCSRLGLRRLRLLWRSKRVVGAVECVACGDVTLEPGAKHWRYATWADGGAAWLCARCQEGF